RAVRLHSASLACPGGLIDPPTPATALSTRRGRRGGARRPLEAQDRGCWGGEESDTWGAESVGDSIRGIGGLLFCSRHIPRPGRASIYGEQANGGAASRTRGSGCRVLRGPELATVDQLDPVAVRIGHEGDQRQVLPIPRVVRRLLRR